MRVESDEYIDNVTLFFITHTTMNSCRFTCKRANHIAIKPKAEPSKQKVRTIYIHNYKNEVMVSRKMHKVNTIRRPIRTKSRKWLFRRMNILYMYTTAHPSNLFIIKSSKNYHFAIFATEFHFHSAHFTLFQPDFLLQFYWCSFSFSLTVENAVFSLFLSPLVFIC